MEPQFKSSKWQIIAKFALVYTLIVIGFGLVLYLFNLTLQASMVNGLVNIVALSVSIYFAIVSNRDNIQNGFITYGQGVALGVYISLMAGIILSVYQYLFSTYIAPEMSANIMNETKRQMIESGSSEEEMEAALNMMQAFQKPGYMILAGIGATLIFGLIVSLIVSAFTKREDPDGAYKNLNN
jgi:hypothetical protein